MSGRVWSLLYCFTFSVAQLYAQERLVTGKVISKDDNQPIPGVNVLVAGTMRGTTTGADGSFTITVNESDKVLAFSFIGYQTLNFPLSDQTNLTITLESIATSLQEVVVVGYGVQKKTDITGATANVKGEELSR